MTIWILTRIANDYNQPENDLVAWWPEKPSNVQLGIALKVNTASAAVDALLETGYYREPYSTHYYLDEVSPGPLDVRR